MRKLILQMTATTDGFVCGPNGEQDWFFRTRDLGVKNWIGESLATAGAHIMGRKTFEVMASFWPVTDDSLAAVMNRVPKVVFSKGGFTPEASYGSNPQTGEVWANAAVATDLVADINQLKEQEGGPVVALGGGSFAQELVKNGLVDEFRFSVHPVAIGKGISVFGTMEGLADLQLISSTPFPSGAIVNVYGVKKG